MLVPFGNSKPVVAANSFVAPGAYLIGDVQLGELASVWFGAVLRGDGATIFLGERSNLQDGCVVHTDPGLPVVVDAGVSIGHRAVLHGCRIEEDVLIGMGALVLNGARIGRGSLVAAGTVVLENEDIPPGSLVAGVPGRVRRSTTDAERASIVANAESYVALAIRHAQSAT